MICSRMAAGCVCTVYKIKTLTNVRSGLVLHILERNLYSGGWCGLGDFKRVCQAIQGGSVRTLYIATVYTGWFSEDPVVQPGQNIVILSWNTNFFGCNDKKHIL